MRRIPALIGAEDINKSIGCSAVVSRKEWQISEILVSLFKILLSCGFLWCGQGLVRFRQKKKLVLELGKDNGLD